MTRPFTRSLACAFRGLYITFREERNFRVHLAGMLAAVVLGFYLGLSGLEWGLVIFAIGLVLVAELFNTVVERLGDALSSGSHSPLMRNIKDMSAAAVLLAAVTSLVIGVIVLIVPLVQKVIGL